MLAGPTVARECWLLDREENCTFMLAGPTVAPNNGAISSMALNVWDVIFISWWGEGKYQQPSEAGTDFERYDDLSSLTAMPP
jgi:hypothetical protein